MKNAIQQGSLLDMPILENKEGKPSQPASEKKMSRLEELIAELCPNGVEYKELKSVCNFITGFSFKSSLFKEHGNAICKTTNIIDGYISFDKMDYFDLCDYKENLKKFIIKKNDIVIGMSGTIKVGISNSDTVCYLNQRVGKFIPDVRYLNNKFLYYFLCNIVEKQYANITGGSVKNLSNDEIKTISIPVPPLPVQEEIVRILDTFSELTAELTAELTKRNQQYQYYNNKLLSFDTSIRYEKLIDVCDYVDYRGKTPKKKEEGIFLVTAKNIRKGFIDYEASKEYISEDDYDEVMRRGKPQIGDVVITTEAPCGYVAQIDRENIALAQRVIKYRSKTNQLNNSFLKYVLLGREFQEKLDRAATGSTVKGIKGSRLHQLTIPIPPLPVQERIVSILDRFDALCNDLTSGLPAEIEARKKQYEYYRDKLLTFKEAV